MSLHSRSSGSGRGSVRSAKKPRPLPRMTDGQVSIVRFLFRGNVHLQAYHRFTMFSLVGLCVEQSLFEDLVHVEDVDVMGKFTEKAKAAAGRSAGPVQAKDAGFQKLYPALHEYLTEVTNSDGTVRQTASLSLYTQHGGFSAYLNDKETGQSICASGATVDELLEALEGLLQSSSPPWRASRERQPTGGKRK